MDKNKQPRAKRLVNEASVATFIVGVVAILAYLVLVATESKIEWNTPIPTWPVVLYSIAYNALSLMTYIGIIIVAVDLFVYIKTFLIQRQKFQWVVILGVIGWVLMFLPFLDPWMRMLWY